MFLFQLLAVAGEWDKAKTQLATLAQLSARGADAQRRLWPGDRGGEGSRSAYSPVLPRCRCCIIADWAVPLAKSFGHFARGDADQGRRGPRRGLRCRPRHAWHVSTTKPFDWIADADARFGPSFEAIVNGRLWPDPVRYVIESIKSDGPRDLRDTVWFPVTHRVQGRAPRSPRCCPRAIPVQRRPPPTTVERLGRMRPAWRDTRRRARSAAASICCRCRQATTTTCCRFAT